MHADIETFLLEQGSNQAHLCGINIWPFKEKDQWIQFDSIINMRPSWGNRTRGVDNPAIQKEIIALVNEKIEV